MLKQLFSGQRAALWYVLLVIGLPLLTLVILGLVKLWQNQWLIPVSMIWLLGTLAGYALYRYWPAKLSFKPRNKSDSLITSALNEDEKSLQESLPLRLNERSDWTALDRRVWFRGVQAVEEVLDEKPDWKALPELCMELLTNVSDEYANDRSGLATATSGKTRRKPEAPYGFTLPEVLLVLSVTSSRYRHLLLSHIPYSDRIKVSSLLSLHARQDQIKRGAGWLNTARRTVRLANPLAAVAAELRDQFTNQIFTNLSDKVQSDLKRLLLQELVQVGMDLYSGRLKSSAEELEGYRSQSQAQDVLDSVMLAEPLRVVLAGQVSSGKSSLINALVKRLEAETDILPTTDRTTVHKLSWSADTGEGNKQVSPGPIHLIDTVGLADTGEAVDDLLAIAQQADLLVWVTRATQPARAPEATLYEKLQQAFDDDPSRRPPPMLLVLTHVDQLRPKAEWKPPYDLRSDDTKAHNIRLAIESSRRQIGLPENNVAVPVCLADNREHYNVKEVGAQIMLLREEATHAQLNRRRTERDKHSGSWRERWEQASNLGTVTGKLLVRSVLED